MNLEQAKTKREQLLEEINQKDAEVINLKKEKASIETELNAKKESIAIVEQYMIDKREDLKKLETAIEVMER